jgi:hypothetical protein
MGTELMFLASVGFLALVLLMAAVIYEFLKPDYRDEDTKMWDRAYKKQCRQIMLDRIFKTLWH